MTYWHKLKELGIIRTNTGKDKCPNCISSKKDKSAKDLSVSFQSDRVLYQCHNGCGFKGVIFYDDKPKPVSRKTYKLPEKPPINEEQDNVYKYFEGRKISKETVDRFGVYGSGHKIVFPYYKDGILVNNKYRFKTKDRDKNFTQESSAEQVFFGMDLITDYSRLVITEGEVDCMSLREAGIESVSIPTGGSDTKLECIENCYDWLQKFETFVIAVDNDEVGEKLKNNLTTRLDKTKCKVAKYELESNDGVLSYKDANEVLTQCDYGVIFLQIVIDSAEYIPLDKVTSPSEHLEDTLRFYTYGMEKGLSTGWKNLDEILSIHLGKLCVLTGRPSSGKSRFWKNLLLNLTKSNEYRHLLFDKESSVESTNVLLASMFLHKHAVGYNRLTREELEKSINYFDPYLKILPRIHEWTIDDILNKALECVRRYGINTLTIDPFNRLKIDVDSKQMRLYVRELLSKCGDFAVNNNVLVTIVAHPTKPPIGQKQVCLYNISESADWVNMTDYGIIVHRDYVDDKWSNESKIITEKIKEEHMGNMGSAKLIVRCGAFEDLDSSNLATDLF